VLITLERFDVLTENEKDELFENSIQSYVEYSKELKQKGKNVAMKIISHAWMTYKIRLVKCWRNKKDPFHTYKDLTEEVWENFVTKCESEDFVVNMCSGSNRKMSLTTTSATPVMPETEAVAIGGW
jgi:hypothetical protein